MAIYLGYSDLGGFIVESCRQIVDNKVTFWVVSVNHSEEGKVQTQSRKAAEKCFFKCPIKTHLLYQNNLSSRTNQPGQKTTVSYQFEWDKILYMVNVKSHLVWVFSSNGLIISGNIWKITNIFIISFLNLTSFLWNEVCK